MQITTMNLHLTNNCNLLCKHCLYCSGEKLIYEMNFEEVKNLIDQFAELTNNKGTINIYGGEPLLRKDIFDILEHISKLNLNIGITTNMNVEQDVMDKLVEIPISRITIDLDGASSETHDWLRNKKGHFERSKKYLKYFKSKGKYISVNSVISKKNVGEIEEILEVCKEINVDLINFYIFTPIGRGKQIEELLLDPLEWKNAYERVKKWTEENKPSFGVIWERSYENKENISKLSQNLCESDSFDVFDVRCDGNLYFCGLMLAVDAQSFGNINEKPLKELLDKRYKYIVKNKKGCAALGYLKSGNINNLVDFREEKENIAPVCPYDWKIVYGKNELKKKFTHINI